MNNFIDKVVYTSDNPKLDYRIIFTRIKNGNFEYILGRFWLFRGLYSQYKKLIQIINKPKKKISFQSQIIQNYNLNIYRIVESIKQDSYYDQLDLNEQSLASIVNYAKKLPLSTASLNLSFTYQEYITHLKAKHTIAMADLDEPLKINEIYRLRHDDLLLEISEKYLGYFPEKCDVRLWWSFANNLSSEERRIQSQTIDYHYDIHKFNFLYISFYLTNVDVNSGAHVLVKSSHKNKKISMLLRSARCPDKTIQQYYPQEDIITIQGKAGKCFIEDASCFHKALPPIQRDRLFLQLRYY
ncbi:phytanoyl-CoA dioxygenase family protein [Moorena sp. SIO4A5]|uniref:phytanoyl-CoA dioxygenase family protein n=1 Tax=Moorena sp. SIO4A5 TaxID=2607838 RepID=UPI0013C734D2|nr:phytanoyl-CoA dioxygenase family protein [Moorena sp. SIO4A5]NEO21446.1 hypothetical protein [Moorena sp. SIO4A5]